MQPPILPKDFIYGIHAIEECLLADQQIDKLWIQQELSQSEAVRALIQQARQRHIPIHKLPLAKLNQITRKNHQGVIAFLSPIRFVNLHQVIQATYERGDVPFVLILDRLTDVRNFGAIARTAETSGVHAIVIPNRTTARIGNDAMKTSSGALGYMPVCREGNLAHTVAFLQNSGLKVVACTEKTDTLMYQHQYQGPTALVIGSEEDGISEEILALVDAKAKIPMFGQIGSLNAAVSAGILMYEVVRQRLQPPANF
jgi:23S rRNA (guanosine2251-2'-O)-methyltransferase